jgi:hypothetical protein
LNTTNEWLDYLVRQFIAKLGSHNLTYRRVVANVESVRKEFVTSSVATSAPRQTLHPS